MFYLHICHQLKPNVGELIIYTIYGSYGGWMVVDKPTNQQSWEVDLDVPLEVSE